MRAAGRSQASMRKEAGSDSGPGGGETVNQKTLKTLLSIFSAVLVLCLILLRGDRESEPGVLVEEGLCYKLYADGEIYFLRLKNPEGKTVREDGPMPKRPTVSEEEKGLWSVSLQAGPDITTRWTYFYAPSEGLISETFYGVFDVRERLLVQADGQTLMVRGIFSDEPTWELTAFSQPPALTATTPFRSAAFAEEGKALEVSYLSGEDLHEVSETLPLP